MAQFKGNFKKLSDLLPTFRAASFKEDHKNFAVDEFMRFHSVGDTVLVSFPNTTTSVDERIITHILLRSILENFFWLLYIFDGANAASWSSRFDEYMNGFKREYSKLYADPDLPRKSEIEQSNPSWSSLQKPRDLNSVLVAVKNAHGSRLDYLYFTYRITSFDTHGKTLKSLFSSAFQKDCNFPVLKIEEVIELMADSYLDTWQRIQ
jgi:hypothetical protein